MNKYRIFNNKRYELYHIGPTKVNINDLAYRLRKEGFNAIVIKVDDGWAIYRKRGKRLL